MTIRKSIIAFFLCLAVSGCSELIVGPSDTSHNLDDFVSLGQLVKSRYPFLQFKHVNWDSLLVVYRPKVDQAKGDEIYTVFHDLLAELKDGHIELRTEGGFSTVTYEWPRLQGGKAYNPLVVRKYFDRELRVAGSGNMEYEILPDNIGYIYLAAFPDGNWVYDIDAMLSYMSNTKGLIFDVRNNGGGNAGIANVIVSRFSSAPIAYSSYLPDGTPSWTGTINPGGPNPYHKPVVVLMNGASFSCAELLPELMKQIPQVTTVGDTTGGGGGSNDVFTLPSNKRIKIPTSYLKRFNGEMIEWNGIPPDIRVPQTEADMNQGRDKQLERAIALLR
jgi:C-terminal processing protease CtpA/Prc